MFEFLFGNDANKTKISSRPKNKSVKNPCLVEFLSFGSSGSIINNRAAITGVEYDLVEVARAEDTDSYVRRAFRYKYGHMFKEGYSISGSNPDYIQYIYKRLRSIAEATGISTSRLFWDIGVNIVKFSNAYLVKVRDDKKSIGSIRQDISGKTLKPIAGYFHLPPEQIRIERDENGKILYYRQQVSSTVYKDFPPENIVHFTIDQKTGLKIGTPTLVPVMEDLRLLRRMEENVELLVYQFLFPIYHYRLGSEKYPAATHPDGSNELDDLRDNLKYMLMEGAIVSSERLEIDAIGAEGRALRVESYIDYFRERVFSGLGVSSVDMGISGAANRSTAQSQSQNMIDDVKSIQQQIQRDINFYIIQELMLEGPADFYSDYEDTEVYFEFNEIDTDEKVAKSNATIQLYINNLITEDEARRELRKQPLSDSEREKTFTNLVQKQVIEATAKFASQYAPEPSNGGESKSRVDPENQHGKQKAKVTKRKKDFEDYIIERRDERSHFIREKFDGLEKDILRIIIAEKDYDKEWLARVVEMAMGEIGKKISSYCSSDISYSYNIVTNANGLSYISAGRDIGANADSECQRIAKLIIGSLNKIGHDKDIVLNIRSALDSFRYRPFAIYDSKTKKAYWMGYALGKRDNGDIEASIKLSDNACSICRSRSLILNLKSFTINDIPAFHPECTCELE